MKNKFNMLHLITIKKVNYHKKYKLIFLGIYNDKEKILTEIFYSKKIMTEM